MNIQTLLALLLQVVGSGGGVFALTQVAKVANWFPWINEGQTARVRTLAGVLSAVSVVLMAFADKNVSVGQLQALGMAVVAFSGTWGVAHSIHKLLNKKSPDAV